MLYMQDTRCKGRKTRNNGGGFKWFSHCIDGERDGVGVVLWR